MTDNVCVSSFRNRIYFILKASDSLFPSNGYPDESNYTLIMTKNFVKII